MTELSIIFLEPFYGGSHRAFADGLRAHSRHHIDLLTLPARFWKWRIRGAALELLRKLERPVTYNLVITSSLIDIPLLKALWPGTCPPVLLYFHENQLLYPLSPGEKRDFHYGFSNITSALASEKVIFNSRFHHDAFFRELPLFIRHLPDFRPSWAVETIKARSTVLYPGIEAPPEDPEYTDGKESARGMPPVILWNHRWEHDKNPEEFFQTLYSLKEMGTPFRLIVAGESFSRIPDIFNEARHRLKDELLHFGYAENRSRYEKLLKQADIVVSSSIQENFGLSMVEAMSRGCLPVAPGRLSYPEIIPAELHGSCLYGEQDGMLPVLSGGIEKIRNSPPVRRKRGYAGILEKAMRQYYWGRLIDEYDRLFESAACSCSTG